MNFLMDGSVNTSTTNAFYKGIKPQNKTFLLFWVVILLIEEILLVFHFCILGLK